MLIYGPAKASKQIVWDGASILDGLGLKPLPASQKVWEKHTCLMGRARFVTLKNYTTNRDIIT